MLAARILRNRKGVTAAEYAVLGTAVVIIVAASVSVLGDPVNGAFARVGTVIRDAVDQLISSGAGVGGGQGSAQAFPPPGADPVYGGSPAHETIVPGAAQT
jgi:Flp pilus assembly pilin Flp